MQNYINVRYISETQESSEKDVALSHGTLNLSEICTVSKLL